MLGSPTCRQPRMATVLSVLLHPKEFVCQAGFRRCTSFSPLHSNKLDSYASLDYIFCEWFHIDLYAHIPTVYTYLCIYIYIYVSVCVCVCMYVYIYICMYVCIYIYIWSSTTRDQFLTPSTELPGGTSSRRRKAEGFTQGGQLRNSRAERITTHGALVIYVTLCYGKSPIYSRFSHEKLVIVHRNINVYETVTAENHDLSLGSSDIWKVIDLRFKSTTNFSPLHLQDWPFRSPESLKPGFLRPIQQVQQLRSESVPFRNLAESRHPNGALSTWRGGGVVTLCRNTLATNWWQILRLILF